MICATKALNSGWVMIKAECVFREVPTRTWLSFFIVSIRLHFVFKKIFSVMTIILSSSFDQQSLLPEFHIEDSAAEKKPKTFVNISSSIQRPATRWYHYLIIITFYYASDDPCVKKSKTHWIMGLLSFDDRLVFWEGEREMKTRTGIWRISKIAKTPVLRQVRGQVT